MSTTKQSILNVIGQNTGANSANVNIDVSNDAINWNLAVASSTPVSGATFQMTIDPTAHGARYARVAVQSAAPGMPTTVMLQIYAF
jgi:Domain of unknown function (DUF6385)